MDRHRILVVEDDGIVASDLERCLTGAGCEVVGWACSGEEAFEKAKEFLPDLILMDINLGDEKDGIQVAEDIRNEMSVPVVYLSAYSGSKIIQRAKATESLGYVLKPFSERQLCLTIEMAMYRHQMEVRQERLIREMRETFDEFKTEMKNMICSSCRKTRDEQIDWRQYETFTAGNGNSKFSH